MQFIALSDTFTNYNIGNLSQYARIISVLKRMLLTLAPIWFPHWPAWTWTISLIMLISTNWKIGLPEKIWKIGRLYFKGNLPEERWEMRSSESPDTDWTDNTTTFGTQSTNHCQVPIGWWFTSTDMVRNTVNRIMQVSGRVTIH